MRIDYHPHAIYRMRQRRITATEVKETLLWYDVELPGRRGRRNRYRTIKNRRVRVTFDCVNGNHYYIWTVTVDEVATQ